MRPTELRPSLRAPCPFSPDPPSDPPVARTFCDIWATYPDKPPTVFKVLSQDPAYPDAPTEGVRRVLEHARGVAIPRGQPIDVTGVKAIRMGTTGASPPGLLSAWSWC